MVETKGGRDELARVSVVSRETVLYDAYVLPEGEVTDYRTPYSGITAAYNITSLFLSIIFKPVTNRSPFFSINHKVNITKIFHCKTVNLNL